VTYQDVAADAPCPSAPARRFSQGSAQAFAAFVLFPELATKVKLFIALAAPPRAKGLSQSYLSTLVESNPRFIYLLFGRQAMLSSCLMWMKIMSPQLFVYTVDVAMYYLFQWSAKEISRERKIVLYQHIFSYSSVKTVVQWFQLIKLRKLAMYQDTNSSNRVRTSISPRRTLTSILTFLCLAFGLPGLCWVQIPVVYDLHRLRVPVAIFYGGKDTVIDVEALVKELPNCVRLYREESYEHLDCIWADSAVKKLFPQIVELLKKPTF
jgi:lysosomal acid lipase/cholesteryl ester hydrolase